jgi:hypothetical protein
VGVSSDEQRTVPRGQARATAEPSAHPSETIEASRDARGERSSLARYEEALARVEAIHSRLEQASRALRDQRGVAEQPDEGADVAPDAAAPVLPIVSPVPRRPVRVEPAAAPDGGGRRLGPRVAAAAVASGIVIVAVAAATMLPGQRGGAGARARGDTAAVPVTRGDEALARDDVAAGPSGSQQDWRVARHVNRTAGYSFSYPQTWSLSDRGEVSTVSSPDGRYVVSFALGPREDLPVTYESFVALLERTYRNVHLTHHRTADLSAGPSVLVAGRATNTAGGSVHFRALLLASGSGRPAIGGIAATEGAGRLDGRFTDLLTSVKPV